MSARRFIRPVSLRSFAYASSGNTRYRGFSDGTLPSARPMGTKSAPQPLRMFSNFYSSDRLATSPGRRSLGKDRFVASVPVLAVAVYPPGTGPDHPFEAA